jgi:hypothetical protein
LELFVRLLRRRLLLCLLCVVDPSADGESESVAQQATSIDDSTTIAPDAALPSITRTASSDAAALTSSDTDGGGTENTSPPTSPRSSSLLEPTDSDSGSLTKSGYVWKRKKKLAGISNWRLRWLEINDDRLLSYYATPSDMKPIGTIESSTGGLGVRRMTAAETSSEYRYCFELSTATSKVCADAPNTIVEALTNDACTCLCMHSTSWPPIPKRIWRNGSRFSSRWCSKMLLLQQLLLQAHRRRSKVAKPEKLGALLASMDQEVCIA